MLTTRLSLLASWLGVGYCAVSPQAPCLPRRHVFTGRWEIYCTCPPHGEFGTTADKTQLSKACLLYSNNVPSQHGGFTATVDDPAYEVVPA